eukprot:gnl/MRDRNA2_/MRDRNA2_19423_c0_seq1.p1 gnl/MRDRNA2_/MRDRNA2_19423_c0~~gnl/MRDRNA2_/MRDRNA2_19423_c0_seq1.p1  ORF type:complete len:1099 (+),score=224.75 gnl/MRDRNA2_/MRDRNA2_19423_c0_seq1:99-3299(+)
MEGVVVENRVECRNCLVLFDSSSTPVIVGYKYLESIGSGESGQAFVQKSNASAPADMVNVADNVVLPVVAPPAKSPLAELQTTKNQFCEKPMEQESEVIMPIKPPSPQNNDQIQSPLTRRQRLSRKNLSFSEERHAQDANLRPSRVSDAWNVPTQDEDSHDICQKPLRRFCDAVDTDADVEETVTALGQETVKLLNRSIFRSPTFGELNGDSQGKHSQIPTVAEPLELNSDEQDKEKSFAEQVELKSNDQSGSRQIPISIAPLESSRNDQVGTLDLNKDDHSGCNLRITSSAELGSNSNGQSAEHCESGSLPRPAEHDKNGDLKQTRQVSHLEKELHQKDLALQSLDEERMHLQAEVHAKDQASKNLQAELADALTQLQLVKKLLGSREDEVSKLRAQLQVKDRKIVALGGELSAPSTPRTSRPNSLCNTLESIPDVDKILRNEDPLADALQVFTEEEQKEVARNQEVVKLRKLVEESSHQMRRLELAQEKELADAELFIKSLAQSSAQPVLTNAFDLKNMSILGKGCYGYITLCNLVSSDISEEKVVMKWQSERWATVVMKEWAHGSEGKHPHIVEYMNVFMHADEDHAVAECLKGGFTSGAFKGKQPKRFPDCWFCIAVEYMDQGTVQNLMDKDILTLESIGAITNQISSALAFMHSKKRTHNDIKPENILLRTAREGNCLLAKLADFGMANHSVDRKRDCELLGYSIWCMGLSEKFVKVPVDDGPQAAALQEFKTGPPQKSKKQTFNQGIWDALHDVIDGLWAMRLEMRDVKDMETFAALQVKVPASAKKKLEKSARDDLHRRSEKRQPLFEQQARLSVAHSCPDLTEFDVEEFPDDGTKAYTERELGKIQSQSVPWYMHDSDSESALCSDSENEGSPKDPDNDRFTFAASSVDAQAENGAETQTVDIGKSPKGASARRNPRCKGNMKAPDWSAPLQLDHLVKDSSKEMARTILTERISFGSASPVSPRSSPVPRRRRSLQNADMIRNLKSGEHFVADRPRRPSWPGPELIGQQKERKHSVGHASGTIFRGFLRTERGSFDSKNGDALKHATAEDVDKVILGG